jgi:broad specificity phosphatase PhoE
MIVTLMRHHKVNYAWKKTYTAAEYRKAEQQYDKAEILDQLEPLTEVYQKIIISSLPRTLATLRILKGDVKYISTPLLNEVPMEPFSHKPRRYSRHLLNAMARIQWMLNNSRQIETRKETFERARAFIANYLTTDENCLIIGHRFFLRILSIEMRRHGFVGKLIVRINNGEKVRFYRDQTTPKAEINEENV